MATRAKTETTLAEDYANFRQNNPSSDSLLLLLGENGRKYSDCSLRFSTNGKSYSAHRIILSAALTEDPTDEYLTGLADKAPLDASLESFVLGILYGSPLPETLPVGLLDCLKLFVRITISYFPS